MNASHFLVMLFFGQEYLVGVRFYMAVLSPIVTHRERVKRIREERARLVKCVMISSSSISNMFVRTNQSFGLRLMHCLSWIMEIIAVEVDLYDLWT